MRGRHELTPSQREAVEHLDGPLLVLAGPGSGKTRVVTRRIARMVERGVDPRSILAITFTNKAAGEMQTRVAGLLPGVRVWVSTFHRLCARLLRERADAVGLRPNFTVYDTADQHQALRQVVHDLGFDAVQYPPARLGARISRLKNDLCTAEEFVRLREESVGSHWDAVLAQVYPAYQQVLLQANAVDFDDLLLHVVDLLTENPEIRRALDERFRYVLVDEYQDTNLAQYRLVAALSQDHPNLCVTGDPDQSIYGWRGARIDNILRFEADFPTAAVVRLEQNFRSTPQILEPADRLISYNRLRKHKALRTENADGPAVELLCFDDGVHEAECIAAEIRRMVDAGERNWADFAVFYRVNALSREIELALARHRVPYQVAAGSAFFDRSEVKDVLAYLRLVHNPNDAVAFRRVINTPPRGIGKISLGRLLAWAATQGLGPLEAAARAAEHPNVPKRAAAALQEFAGMIDDFSVAAGGPVAELLKVVVEETGYARAWIDSESEEDQQRLANVEELLTAAAQHDKAREAGADAASESGEALSPLEGFLETASLVSDTDTLDDSTGCVTLMTLHAAKGLEYPVVYVLGVEHNLLPHERALMQDDPRELEEERRLLFVGMTRAREQLFLTQTRAREFRGRRLTTIPSQFLPETGAALRDCTTESASPAFDEWDGFAESWGGRAGAEAAPGGSPERQALDRGGHDPTDWDGVPEREVPRPVAASRPLLTTAADLLKGTAAPAAIPLGFSIGMQVRHPRYGLGTVVQVSGLSKRRTVTVEFRDERRETFVAAKCPLQPAGLD